LTKEASQKGGNATKARYGGLEVCPECGQLKPPYFSELARKQSREAKRRGGLAAAGGCDMAAKGAMGGRPRRKA